MTDNNANAYIGMGYAKYIKQNALIMRIDIEKARPLYNPMEFCESYNS